MLKIDRISYSFHTINFKEAIKLNLQYFNYV